MMTVWIVKVYFVDNASFSDDGMNIDGVYAAKQDAIDRAADLADYCGMEVEEDNDCFYSNESGECIEVVEMDVL